MCFCEHTEEPRFIGELVHPDDLSEEGDDLPIPRTGLWLCPIRRLDDHRIFEEQDMYDSLEVAFKAHEAATGRPISPVRIHAAAQQAAQ